jgi:hypothetical protein
MNESIVRSRKNQSLIALLKKKTMKTAYDLVAQAKAKTHEITIDKAEDALAVYWNSR